MAFTNSYKNVSSILGAGGVPLTGTVTTDASLTGAGTVASPLIVARSATEPPQVGSGTVGTANESARSDHTHNGISSLSVGAGIARTGAISLVEGAGIDMTDNGDGSFTIASTVTAGTLTGAIGYGTGLSSGVHVFNHGLGGIPQVYAGFPTGQGVGVTNYSVSDVSVSSTQIFITLSVAGGTMELGWMAGRLS